MSGISALVCLCALQVAAQSTATLSGTVTDPSGAVVANAQVTVHSIDTGADHMFIADSAGLYAVPSLQPGEHKVQVTAPGFNNFTPYPR